MKTINGTIDKDIQFTEYRPTKQINVVVQGNNSRGWHIFRIEKGKNGTIRTMGYDIGRESAERTGLRIAKSIKAEGGI